jgi:hypothetical protein
MSDTSIKSVPEDFPHGDGIGSVAGAQPKFAARLIEGRYVVGETEEERLERYLICDDLAAQLSDYCRRKGSENPGWTKEFILQRTDQGVTSHIRSGRWDISIPEKGWVMQRCKELLGW